MIVPVAVPTPAFLPVVVVAPRPIELFLIKDEPTTILVVAPT
jgi:hypothetical protein